MQWNEYRIRVREGAFDKDGQLLKSQERKLILAALGLGGEGGEVIDHIKKAAFHPGRTLNREDLILEAGDQLWYFTLLLDALDVTLEEVMDRNIAKLQARYPSRY